MDFKRDIPGWLHSNDVGAIERIARMSTGNILEVGPYAGRTTQVIASCCPTQNIYCIDPWPLVDPTMIWEGMNDYTGGPFDVNGVKELFEHHILNNYSNVTAIQGKFPDNLPAYMQEDLGLIYWETDQVDKVLPIVQQLKAAWSILRPGGVLASSMFAYWMPNIVQAVRQFAMLEGIDITLPASSCIWYAVKPE